MNFRFLYLLPTVLILSILFSGFGKKDPIPKNTYYQPIDETCHFAATLDGKPFSYTDNQEGYKTGNNLFKTLKKLPDSSKVIYQSYFYKVSGGDVIIELNLGTLKFLGMKPSAQNFANFFKPGPVKFAVMAFDGVEIKYHDKKGNIWSTSNGFQAGSFFELTELQNDSNSVKFKALFSCMLYNAEHDSRKLENGVFVGYFTNN